MNRVSCFAGVCLFLASAGARAVTVDAGPTASQVIQADANNVGRFDLSGTAGVAGAVQAHVLSGETEVVAWTQVGAAADGKWAGALEGVPVGGPYRVGVRVLDAAGAPVEEVVVEDVLVGDVWLLAGQSNMQGVGARIGSEEPDPRVRVFAMNFTWRVAKDPLHVLSESPHPVHFDPAKSPEQRQAEIAAEQNGPKGGGLGVTFGKEMLRRTNRPVGLIAAAHGGTSMAQWDPALRDQGGASLYGSMHQQVMAAGGKLRGVLWYQGESDAGPEAVPLFMDRLKALVAAMRADFASPELPFYQVQISRFVQPDVDPVPWNQIQNLQLASEAQIAQTAVVSAIDLPLDDAIHIGSAGLRVLGFRLANLAEKFQYGAATLTGPRFEAVKRVDVAEGIQIRVSFTGVNGALLAAGRVHGFSISSGPEAADLACIYKMEIAPDAPNTVILWVSTLPENPHLWYGRGLDPYCNVVDSANMAVPVFGPQPMVFQ